MSDWQWVLVVPPLPCERGRPGRPYSAAHRVTVKAILWIARTGGSVKGPARLLPELAGHWEEPRRAHHENHRNSDRQGRFVRFSLKPRCSVPKTCRL